MSKASTGIRLGPIITALTLLFSATVVSAQDNLRAEIIQHVIDPCFLQSAKKHGLVEKLGEATALRNLKTMLSANVENMVSTVRNEVRNHGIQKRKAVYHIFLSTCIAQTR